MSWSKPQSLAYSTDDGLFFINEDVLKCISVINTPIVVVAIAGLYRTGKSYLLNILVGAKTGFPLGRSIQATTKGIWVWCTAHPTQPNTTLLLMDTEGLGDVKKGDTDKDQKLFTLTVLMCRALCYNHIGVLNEDIFEKIALSSKLSRMVYYNTQRTCSPPALILCLRDFDKDLEIDGEVVTEDEYLEKSLQPGSAKNQQHTLRTREAIKKLFLERKCFTFDKPGGRKILRNLDQTPEKELSKDFLDDAKKFMAFIYTLLPGILPGNIAMNGPAFCTLFSSFVEALNSGEIPDIPCAFQRLQSQENEKRAQHVEEKYLRRLANMKLPMLGTAEFNSICECELQNCLKEIRELVQCDESDRFESHARRSMSILIKERRKENEDKAFAYWKNVVEKRFDKKIGPKRSYYCIGGYQQYLEKLEAFDDKWQNEFRGKEQVERKRAYKTFMLMKADEKDEIFFEEKKLIKKKENEDKINIAYMHKNQMRDNIEKTRMMLENIAHRAEDERKRQRWLLREKHQDYLAHLCDMERKRLKEEEMREIERRRKEKRH